MTDINDKKNDKTLYGLIELTQSIECKSSVLGCREPISVGGISGYLLFPRLPEGVNNAESVLRQPLLPPLSAQTWKQGERLIRWGRPTRYPSMQSGVERILLEFLILEEESKTAANAIYSAFPTWYSMFVDYFELITKQRLYGTKATSPQLNNLDLFTLADDFRMQGINDPTDQGITITSYRQDTNLSLQMLSDICKYCSLAKPPALAYRIMLEAYRAFSSGDYRKAIVEAATAAEIVLGQEIKSALLKAKVSYADQLLKKYRMLSGRFELAKMVGVGLPVIDFKILLIEPRNEIVHKADFANEEIALRAIRSVDELLLSISPYIGEIDK